MPGAVPVVIAEDGEDGDREAAARLGEHLGLLRKSSRGQVAREQDDVGLVFHALERLLDPLARRLGRVDVAGCRDPYHDRHVAHSGETETAAACRSPPSRSWWPP